MRWTPRLAAWFDAARDPAIGVLFAADAVVTTLAERQAVEPWAALGVTLVAGAVAVRRRMPFVAALASTGVLLEPGVDGALWLLGSVLVLGFSIAAYAAPPRSAIGLAVLLCAGIAVSSREGLSPSAVIVPLIIVGAPAAAGALLRRSRMRAERLRALHEDLAAERARSAALAARAERARVARDLHDILGHTLSTVIVQSGAAEALVPPDHPASGPVAAIADGARDALAEVRSLVALARQEPAPEAPPSPPLPRLPARGLPPWWDLALAAAVIAGAVGSVLTTPALLSLAVPIAAAVGLRTRAPLVMLAVVAAGMPVLGAISRDAVDTWAFAEMLVVGFSIGVALRGRTLVAAVAVLLAGAYLLPDDQPTLLGKALVPVVQIGGPVAVGVLVARAQDLGRRLTLATAALTAERDHVARLAAVEERRRLADELADVLGHTLSAVIVQASAAQQLLTGHAGRGPVDAVLSEAHRALSEVRDLLDPEAPASGCGPAVGAVPVLAAASGARLTVHGAPIALDPAASLAAYRVVQEALTNARRHAPGVAVTVLLDWRHDSLALTIENGGPSAERRQGGHGLAGMTERVQAVSGYLDAGPRDGGGWRVSAVLPARTAVLT